ncbi:MAG: hypothetical protein ACW98Y_10150 [Candidatus Thorarchaeota archaeon]|jgi:hypothetical protein
MKLKVVKRVLLVTGFLALFVASASMALAFPSNNNPCDQCHTTTDILTIVSNATGTVDATAGVPFVLEVDASNGAELIKIVSDWSNNDQFTFSVMEIEDESGDDTDAAIGEITVELTVSTTAVGTHTIEIWTAAATQLSAQLTVTVDVTENTDTTLPTTTTTPTTPTETTTDPVETFTTMMYLFNAVTAVLLIVFAIVMLKRTNLARSSQASNY